MKIRLRLGLFTLALATVGLAACNSGSTLSSIFPTPAPSASITAQQLIALPGLAANGPFSYDIGIVDTAARRYYLADRTNATLDIVDLNTFGVRQVSAGFTGQKPSNDQSGPDGVAFIPNGAVYVGDVNVIKVIDPVAGTLTATIPTGTAGFRTDEGCYDPDDKLMMFANPADSPPYATFVSTVTNTVVAKLSFPGSAGLEACVYDPVSKKFYINNDGTPANPSGELDSVVASAAAAGAPVLTTVLSEGACGPTGIDLGPNGNLVIGCDAPAGSPQITLIVNIPGKAIVKTITQVGGEDEVAYDAKFNRYYTASRHWTASGISQTGNTGAVYTPVLGVIDAATNTWIQNLPTGSNAHSVAADAATGRVFVPVPSTATTAGGVQVFGP